MLAGRSGWVLTARIDVFASVKPIEIYNNIDYVGIKNVTFKDPTTALSKVILTTNNLVTLVVQNCRTLGTNMDYITDVASGKTFTNFFHSGNEFISLTSAHRAQTPTNTLTSGSVGL